jgi:lipoprotein-anchoring transpeptidase ErfK/SrfK
MRRPAIAVASAASVLLALLAGNDRAAASVVVTINKSTQRMSVAVNGSLQFTWPVSTGRAPYGTPNGTFTPQMMARSWFSRKYYNSPMPHSIFYYKGYAIHGTTHISRLGGPASHGCVRLHPRNAATLFALVQSHGKANTRIVVTGSGGVRRARNRSI